MPDCSTILAISMVMGVCAVFLCGPFAVLLHYARYPLWAAIVGGISIWSGIFWYVHTYTYFKWLGLLSAACGLFVLWQTAKSQ